VESRPSTEGTGAHDDDFGGLSCLAGVEQSAAQKRPGLHRRNLLQEPSSIEAHERAL
jgi:hypothetical protein